MHITQIAKVLLLGSLLVSGSVSAASSEVYPLEGKKWGKRLFRRSLSTEADSQYHYQYPYQQSNAAGEFDRSARFRYNRG